MPFRPLPRLFNFDLTAFEWVHSINGRIGKDVEGSCVDLMEILSWRLAGVPAEIRTEHLSNTSVKRYRYVKPQPPPPLCVCVYIYIYIYGAQVSIVG
jgi:hypothetical protein